MQVQAIAAAQTPRVITGDAFDAALEQTQSDLARLQEYTQEIARPLMGTLARFGERVRAFLSDPRVQYELALHRRQDRAQDRVRRIGRFIRRALTRVSAPLLSGSLLAALARYAQEQAARAATNMLQESQHTQAHRQELTTEGVTCLRAPRAHLHRAAA